LLYERRDELAAWIVHEGGRTWGEALADVDEAVDHLAYQAERLLALQPALERDYRPRGVVAVIPPWNFPAALPLGMASGALLAGNSVVLKPAEQTPVIAHYLVRALHDAGVPPEVLVLLPGHGETVGARLAESPGVDMVAFTGSKAVGMAIYRSSSRVRLPGGKTKKVVAEMGGKNAIVVFPDADMDEAVRGIVLSAFEHANQKCSACSRAFVHRAIFARLRDRLCQAVLSLPVGLADDPDTLLNPLIASEARERVLAYARHARTEGKVLVDRVEEPGAGPLQVGPMVVELDPALIPIGSAVIAREEIFGPILALIPFDDEAAMLEQVNGTGYALTAGVFSRSPRTIARMARGIRAGNIYVNRKITGARVGIEPFGGFQLSGTGPKAGGADYLFAFVTRRERPAGGAEGRCVSDTPPFWPGAIKHWRAGTTERSRALARGLRGLRGGAFKDLVRAVAWGYRMDPSRAETMAREALDVAEKVLSAAPEVAAPEPTLAVPGQRNYTTWETPRGKGFMATDDDASPARFVGMVFGPLLASNGLVLAPSARQRGMASVLTSALHAGGVPAAVLALPPEAGTEVAEALAADVFHFAVTDLGAEATQRVYERLGETREADGQRWLKALISMQDGPLPGEPGFLRRFALPKTVAIRTLRHGAELELG
ncbi:MAG: aldehyde dehydrogenase family protein, partial [Chloroflexi bacterium]|nr:aldehyde dehydrogenase family protein [Chloroflexota bacterium]